MTRPILSLYALVLLVAILAAGVGFKAGRYYPHPDTGFMHMFHHESNVLDWLRRPV
jgi:hypothetical protein